MVSRWLYPPCHTLLRPTDETDEVAGTESAYGLTLALRAGWYMIECQMTDDRSTLRFSFDEHTSFDLVTKSDTKTKRVIHLPKNMSFIHVNLGDTADAESVQHLRFVPLRRSFAFQRMLKRLRATEQDMQYLARRCDRPFEAFLFGAYNNLFSTDRDAQYQQWIKQVEPRQFDAYTGRVLAECDEAEFVFFCAPGYQVLPETRQLMVSSLLSDSQAQLVYADEDVIDAAGGRSNPHFKPDWNPDLFFAYDYVSSFYMCRRSWYLDNRDVFEQYGERLALSFLLPTMSAIQIKHVPLVLAHAQKDQQMDDSLEQGRIEVLKKVFPSPVKVGAGSIPGSCRVRFPLPELLPLVSLLIPTRDGLSVLKPCVESILQKTSYQQFEILILDNQSEEPETLQWFAEIQQNSKINIITYDQPFNYSAINNYGVQHAKGSVIGLINNDVEVISAGWLSEMVSQALRPAIGCVGAKLYYSNGQVQHGGVVLGLGDVAGHAHRYLQYGDDGYQGRLKLVQNYSAVTAACLIVGREIYEEVGGLEEHHLTVAYNDVDFCLRVREAGYRNLWTPYAELYHHESISRGQDDTPVKKARYANEVAYMQSTWGDKLVNDPCYNPNLARKREDFSLREF